MQQENFCFHFTSAQTTTEVYQYLLNPRNWWVGLFNEIISGNSVNINDEFSFSAGEGAHFSKQKLVEANPAKSIMWQVTDSNLSFLENPKEWINTKFGFTISEDKNQTIISFIHEGLNSDIECYESCTNAWTQYLHRLALKLNEG